MKCIAIGIDVSKGRADIAIINQSGTLLEGSGGYDDTHNGHERIRIILRDLRQRYPESRLIAGVEATAGYERSWVALFKRERQAGRSVVVHRLNPLAVKRFLEADLHRKVDDKQAAAGIARFLLERLRTTKPADIPLDGRVVLYRQIRAVICQRTSHVQRLQSLLPAANPELVQYCRHGVPDWILAVCARYPTAAHLARGHINALANIAHVGRDRAAALKAAARTSTAALTDDATAITMRLLVTEIQALDDRIKKGKASLEPLMADDPRVELVDGIPGIGRWSAIALVLEIGDPTRFNDARQLIAWAGLDPRNDESGDGQIKRGISRRGNVHLRAILFPLVMAAMHHHPVVADFVARKVSEGKPKKVAMVAGAAKLLRIVFAIMVSQKPYDPNHEATRAKAKAEDRQTARSNAPDTTPEPMMPDLSAPVSAKEARRRRQTINAAAPRTPVCEVEPQGVPGTTASIALQTGR